MINRKLVICCVVAAVASLNISKENLQDLEIRLEEIKNQLNEGGNENETRSERMKKIYSNIPLSNTRGVENSFLCGMCYVIVDNFLWMRRIEKLNDEFLESLAISICVDLEIQSEEVCNGIVEFNAPSLLYIVDNRSDLSADTACKLLLNDGDCINPYNDDNLEFTVEISERTTSNQSIKFTENSHNLTIIHITDIHFDPKYKPGAFADCEEYACCREIDDVNEFDPTSNAGLWGDYRSCDSSRNAILDAFYQIRKQHSVSFYSTAVARCVTRINFDTLRI